MKTESITFHGAQIPCAQDDNGDVFVAITPICQAIGIDPRTQKDAIKSDGLLGGVVRTFSLPSKSAEQETLCLPLKYLSGWLFQINTKLIKPEAKELLLAYKRECYDVLHAHFFKAPETPKEDKDLAAHLERFNALKEYSAGLKKQRSLIDKEIYETNKRLQEYNFSAPLNSGQLKIAFSTLLNLPE